MSERNGKTLADAIEPKLLEQTRKRFAINVACESKDEAAELARELKTRGWRAGVTTGFDLKTSKAHVVVRCTGRRQQLAAR